MHGYLLRGCELDVDIVDGYVDMFMDIDGSYEIISTHLHKFS